MIVNEKVLRQELRQGDLGPAIKATISTTLDDQRIDTAGP